MEAMKTNNQTHLITLRRKIIYLFRTIFTLSLEKD